MRVNFGTIFGGLDIIFAGDFTQLKPVKAKPLYLEEDFKIWEQDVHTCFELKTNHRFKNDPEGENYWDVTVTKAQVCETSIW